MQKKRQWAPRLMAVSASLMLASCGGLRTTYLADGSQGYLVTCKGFLNSWESCLVKAGKICESRGYNTIRSEQYDRTLLISCKTPGSAASTASS